MRDRERGDMQGVEMTQALIDFWNSDPNMEVIQNNLGMRLLEADDEHALLEVRFTDFNKAVEFWGGWALLGVAEWSAGIVTNYERWTADAEAGVERVGLAWMTSELTTHFVSNTRREKLLCESRWAVRGETQAIVTTQIRADERVILHATSTHTKL